MPAFPVNHANGLVLTTSAERAAATASSIAVCRATSPKKPLNTRRWIPSGWREGCTPHAACAMANAHACSGVHPLPLTTLSPRLTRAPTAAAPRWRMIAAMTAFTVFESPDVQAARSNVAMPALVFIVFIMRREPAVLPCTLLRLLPKYASSSYTSMSDGSVDVYRVSSRSE